MGYIISYQFSWKLLKSSEQGKSEAWLETRRASEDMISNCDILDAIQDDIR